VVGLLILLCRGTTHSCRPLIAKPSRERASAKTAVLRKMKMPAAQLMLDFPFGLRRFCAATFAIPSETRRDQNQISVFESPVGLWIILSGNFHLKN
jgi:hypothetical protein